LLAEGDVPPLSPQPAALQARGRAAVADGEAGDRSALLDAELDLAISLPGHVLPDVRVVQCRPLFRAVSARPSDDAAVHRHRGSRPLPLVVPTVWKTGGPLQPDALGLLPACPCARTPDHLPRLLACDGPRGHLRVLAVPRSADLAPGRRRGPAPWRRATVEVQHAGALRDLADPVADALPDGRAEQRAR